MGEWSCSGFGREDRVRCWGGLVSDGTGARWVTGAAPSVVWRFIRFRSWRVRSFEVAVRGSTQCRERIVRLADSPRGAQRCLNCAVAGCREQIDVRPVLRPEKDHTMASARRWRR